MGRQNTVKAVLKFKHLGFHQAEAFSREKNNATTLYWNPDLKLEQSNKATVSFYTANTSATYKVILEGITSNGIPFKTEVSFEVK